MTWNTEINSILWCSKIRTENMVTMWILHKCEWLLLCIHAVHHFSLSSGTTHKIINRIRSQVCTTYILCSLNIALQLNAVLDGRPLGMLIWSLAILWSCWIQGQGLIIDMSKCGSTLLWFQCYHRHPTRQLNEIRIVMTIGI